MGTIAQKLSYLSSSIDDIQAAISECDVEINDSMELGSYGDKIRSIKNINGNCMKDFYTMTKTNELFESDINVFEIEDITSNFEF